MEELIDKIRGSLELRPEAEEFLYSISKEKILAKGEVIIRQGQKAEIFYFLITGSGKNCSLDLIRSTLSCFNILTHTKETIQHKSVSACVGSIYTPGSREAIYG